jgi:hypothetical protein
MSEGFIFVEISFYFFYFAACVLKIASRILQTVPEKQKHLLQYFNKYLYVFLNFT